jgi:hypothetical protein
MGATSKKNSYLAEAEHAEHEMLACFHEYVDHFRDVMDAFGIVWRHAWYLVEFPTEALVPGIVGEVDILTGPLEPEDPDQFHEVLHACQKSMPDAPAQFHLNFAAMSLAFEGGLRWPPSVDYLVGAEVKSSYLPMNAQAISLDEMKSTKTSQQDVRKIRRSIDKLQKLGLNKVGLFELLATPPADGIGSRPWSIASQVAGKTLEVMGEVFAQRLPEDSPAGHGVVSISGIKGREEFASGSTSFDIVRQPKNNPLLNDRQIESNRTTLQRNLTSILGDLPRPRGMPPVFIYDKKRKTIRYANEGWIRC